MAHPFEVEALYAVDARVGWGMLAALGPSFRQELASPFGAAIRTGIDRASAEALPLAVAEARSRGRGRSHPGRRMWQTVRIVKAREAGANRYSGGLVAGAADVPYARIQELGGVTRPHVILPRNASVLAFFWQRTGRMMFLRYVNHPGSRIPARPYLAPARNKKIATVKREVGAAMKEAMPRGLKTAMVLAIKSRIGAR